MTTYRVAIPETCDIHGLSLEEAELLVREYLADEAVIPFWFKTSRGIRSCLYRDKNLTKVLAQIDAEDFWG